MQEATAAEEQQRIPDPMETEPILPPIRWRRTQITFEVHVSTEEVNLCLTPGQCRRAAEAVARALDLDGLVCVAPVRLVLARGTFSEEGESDAAGVD